MEEWREGKYEKVKALCGLFLGLLILELTY